MTIKEVEHIAVASNSVEDSDKFFIELLGLKKVKDFLLPLDLTKKLFEINKEQRIVRYSNDTIIAEIFITDDNSKAKDVFTHPCIIIDDREKLIEKATSMGFPIIKALRKDRDDYILFIKDFFGNLYEIK